MAISILVLIVSRHKKEIIFGVLRKVNPIAYLPLKNPSKAFHIFTLSVVLKGLYYGISRFINVVILCIYKIKNEIVFAGLLPLLQQHAIYRQLNQYPLIKTVNQP